MDDNQSQQSSSSSQQQAPQNPPQAGGAVHGGNTKLMSVFAYLGILIIIPFLMAKDDPTVKFHLKQGAVLFVIWLILWAVGMTVLGWQFWGIIQLVQLATIVLAIIGIVNVLQDKQKELPLVGGLAKNFNF